MASMPRALPMTFSPQQVRVVARSWRRWLLVETCEDYGDAIRLCLDKRVRRIREGEIAEYLGFAAPHLTKVKNGQGYLTTDQELILQHLCSNWAISQYAEMRKNQLAELIESPAEQIARLHARIAMLERSAA
jgi:hypothetical protein